MLSVGVGEATLQPLARLGSQRARAGVGAWCVGWVRPASAAVDGEALGYPQKGHAYLGFPNGLFSANGPTASNE